MLRFLLSLLNVKNQGLNLVTQEQQKSSWDFHLVAEVQVYFLSINIFVLTLSYVFNNEKFEQWLSSYPTGSVNSLLRRTDSTEFSTSESMCNCEYTGEFKFIAYVKEANLI